jgi:hypothetical protein
MTDAKTDLEKHLEEKKAEKNYDLRETDDGLELEIDLSSVDEDQEFNEVELVLMNIAEVVDRSLQGRGLDFDKVDRAFIMESVAEQFDKRSEFVEAIVGSMGRKKAKKFDPVDEIKLVARRVCELYISAHGEPDDDSAEDQEHLILKK